MMLIPCKSTYGTKKSNKRGSVMKNIIVLMMITISLWAVNKQQLLQAHKEALNVYKMKNKDFYQSIKLLRKAGIQKIFDSKPKGMDKQDYINLLNDYGFFLSLTQKDNIYVETNYCEAKQALEKVKVLDPNRTPVYLNLGDLYWNIFFVHKYITTYNFGVMKSFASGKCFIQDKKEPTFTYQAKQMYLQYAKQMKDSNKETQIPKRLNFILNNNKMFVLTRDYWPDERNATSKPCQDYILALNSLPENKRTYCNRDISKVDTPFKVLEWKDVEEKLRKRFFKTSWDGSYDSRQIAYIYQGMYHFDRGPKLWVKESEYILPQCKYEYLNLNLKHVIYPLCETKGEPSKQLSKTNML